MSFHQFQQVGYHIAATSYKDEIRGAGVCSGCFKGTGHIVKGFALQARFAGDGCQLFGGHGALHARLGEVVLRMHGQAVDDRPHVLVGHHAKDDVQFVAPLCANLLYQILETAWVVPCITYDERMPPYHLPASFQAREAGDMPEAFVDVRIGDVESHLYEFLDRHEDGGGVLYLIISSQFAFNGSPFGGLIGACSAGGLFGFLHKSFFIGQRDGAFHLHGLLDEQFLHLPSSIGFSDDHGHAPLDDTGFFPGYVGEAFAQELGVVLADVRDNAQNGSDDIGAVQTAAHPHLDEGHIHLLLLKILECHGCGQLEETGVERLEEGAFLFHEFHYAFLGNHLAVHADALSEVHQMWTRVEPYAIACLLQDGCQCVAYRSLAVGACHVDGLIGPVGVAHVFVQRQRIVQSFLIRSSSNVLEHRSCIVQVFNSFLIGH